MSKKYTILGLIVALVLVAVFVFGDVSSEDAAGRLKVKNDVGKIHEKTLRTEEVKEVKSREESKVSMESAKDLDMKNEVPTGQLEEADNYFAFMGDGFTQTLQEWCEEDNLPEPNGDGLSDNATDYELDYDVVNVVPVEVGDCEEWAENQTNQSSGGNSNGPNCDHCTDDFWDCMGDISVLSPNARATVYAGCQADSNACYNQCEGS